MFRAQQCLASSKHLVVSSTLTSLRPVGGLLGRKTQASGGQQQQASALCPFPVPAPPAFPRGRVCPSSSHRGMASPGPRELGRVTEGTGGEKGFQLWKDTSPKLRLGN